MNKSVILLLCFVAILIFKFCYNQIKIYRRKKLLSASIPERKCIPFIGQILRLSNLNNVIHEAYSDFIEFKSPVKAFIGHVLMVTIADPNQLQIIFTSPQTAEKPFYYRYGDFILCGGLITAKMKRWKITRKLINPSFHQRILEQYFEIFVSMSQDMVHTLKSNLNQGPFDVCPGVMLNQTDIICRTILGTDSKAFDPNFQLYHILSSLTSEIIFRSFNPVLSNEMIYNYSFTKRRVDQYGYKLINFITKVIENRQRCTEKQNLDTTNNEENRKTLLDTLLEIHKIDDKGVYSQKQLIGELLTMFLAGIDTTSMTISFALVILGIHKNIQNRVLNEILEVVGDLKTVLEFRHVQKMPYLDRVLKEVLRLYPPVPFILRDVEADLKLENHTIPAGAIVTCALYNLHRNPKVWPDPLEFNPDRFLPQESENRHAYSYIPFGAGHRNCIGKAYAMLSIKASIINILRSYEVSCDMKESEFKLRLEVTCRIIGGFNISLTERIK